MKLRQSEVGWQPTRLLLETRRTVATCTGSDPGVSGPLDPLGPRLADVRTLPDHVFTRWTNANVLHSWGGKHPHVPFCDERTAVPALGHATPYLCSRYLLLSAVSPCLKRPAKCAGSRVTPHCGSVSRRCVGPQAAVCGETVSTRVRRLSKCRDERDPVTSKIPRRVRRHDEGNPATSQTPRQVKSRDKSDSATHQML